MSLLERARRAQAGRDNLDAAKATEDDERERTKLAEWATVILGLDPPANAAMLRPAYGGPGVPSGRRALYRFEYEGMRFVVGHYRHVTPVGDGVGERALLAVQLVQVRGWPQWPPPDPRNVVNARWAPAGYHAVYDLSDLADALDESTLSTGELC